VGWGGVGAGAWGGERREFVDLKRHWWSVGGEVVASSTSH